MGGDSPMPELRSDNWLLDLGVPLDRAHELLSLPDFPLRDGRTVERLLSNSDIHSCALSRGKVQGGTVQPIDVFDPSTKDLMGVAIGRSLEATEQNIGLEYLIVARVGVNRAEMSRVLLEHFLRQFHDANVFVRIESGERGLRKLFQSLLFQSLESTGSKLCKIGSHSECY